MRLDVVVLFVCACGECINELLVYSTASKYIYKTFLPLYL